MRVTNGGGRQVMCVCGARGDERFSCCNPVRHELQVVEGVAVLIGLHTPGEEWNLEL